MSKSLVTNLLLSRKLKKIGVEQESYFYWDNRAGFDGYIIVDKNYFKVDKRNSISAFTATELLEILNNFELRSSLAEIHFSYYKTGTMKDSYMFLYKHDSHCEKDIRGKTAIECLAKAIIYLKQNNLTN